MKSYFLLLLILFGVCFLFTSKEEKEIRIRVISNSDSVIDIKYKNTVVGYLKGEILPFIELSDKSFEENYQQIEKLLNEEFREFDINVDYQKHTFKNKTYNDSVIKNGRYKTLLIMIGNAEGSNWWGSIFNEKLQYESSEEVRYEWYFKKNRNGEEHV